MVGRQWKTSSGIFANIYHIMKIYNIISFLGITSTANAASPATAINEELGNAPPTSFIKAHKEYYKRTASNNDERRLSCFTSAAWHPFYAAGWTSGHCRYTVDCDSPSYSTELACCKNAYAGQMLGYCISMLPTPPTARPTETGKSLNRLVLLILLQYYYLRQLNYSCGQQMFYHFIGGPNTYYADYTTAWDQAYCINTRPIPSGRPTYIGMLACCKAAYSGQISGASNVRFLKI